MLSVAFHTPPPDAPQWGSSITDVAAAHVARLRAPGALEKIELPVLPEVAQRVFLALERPEADMRVVSETVRRDPTFAAHLLRIANSPAYAARSPITSLQQAVSRLGTRVLREIAIVVACKARAFQVKGYEPLVRTIFEHSLATALYAREVARLRRLDVESAFLAGLLHDVGRPLVIQCVTDFATQHREPTLSETEMESVATILHEEVGSAIIAAWNLPESIVQAVRLHHEGTDEAGAELVSLVRVADHLAHTSSEPEDAREDVAALGAFAALNLYPEEIDALRARGKELLEQARALS
jgi:putative nucleotidyltransferase with HDIG domain